MKYVGQSQSKFLITDDTIDFSNAGVALDYLLSTKSQQQLNK